MDYAQNAENAPRYIGVNFDIEGQKIRAVQRQFGHTLCNFFDESEWQIMPPAERREFGWDLTRFSFGTTCSPPDSENLAVTARATWNMTRWLEGNGASNVPFVLVELGSVIPGSLEPKRTNMTIEADGMRNIMRETLLELMIAEPADFGRPA